MTLWRCAHTWLAGKRIMRCRCRERLHSAFCYWHQPLGEPAPAGPVRAEKMKRTDLSRLIGQNIAARRSALGLTQHRLGEFAGASQTLVSRWESAEQTPDSYSLRKLAQALGVSMDWLAGLRSPQETPPQDAA